MKSEQKTTDIAVKVVFAGGRSAQQAFIDLIRRLDKAAPGLELRQEQAYTEPVVFPGVHAPERGTGYE